MGVGFVLSDRHWVIHIHFQCPWAKEGQAPGCACVPASQLAAGAGGKCRWQSLPRLRIFTFSNLLSNSLNGMKQRAATPVPRCLRGHRASCQNSNSCHCNQQITAFYGSHTFLTLQCLCNAELIYQISTQSRKLQDSFGSLHNQTLKPKFYNCIGKDTSNMFMARCRITVLTLGFTFNFFLLLTFMTHLQTYIISDTSLLPVRRLKKIRPKGSIYRRYLGSFFFLFSFQM